MLDLLWDIPSFARANNILTTYLCSKSANTASINIDSLGSELRNFVIKYDHGSRQASQLISSEALQVREAIVRQSGKTEEALRTHVTQTSKNLERKFKYRIERDSREQRRAILLKSLKYSGMNERANQVESAHEGTFGWLFADADDSSCSGDEEFYSNGSEELDGQDARSEDDWYDIDTDDEYEQEPPEMVWDSFTDWLQSDLDFYWIMGKPGSGKSTLAKFILSEPRTTIALGKWRPGAIIASHYFWRPGTILQRSIKGMLCSIIYQLVNFIPDAVEYASTNVAGLSHKDGDTDWSVPDLQQLCSGLIEHWGKPLCLLIDGLDECGPEDDQQKLLDTLEGIRLPNVKIIASSRNEPIFEKHFRHEPQLRMQDLTAEDLRTYAQEFLPRRVRSHLCEQLVENAEGVFLWLVLAVHSIKRGSRNGESLEDLRNRIRSLPKGLNDLYKDMWARLNDDCDLYRESAALYFKLKMAADTKQLKCLEEGWSILAMMFASVAKDRWPLAKMPLIPIRQLIKECVEFPKRVQVRCAGLLVLHGRSAGTSLKKGLRGAKSPFLDYINTRVGFKFIHRSAQDFLTDTVEGQNILNHGGMSPEDINIRIVSGSLRAASLIRRRPPKLEAIAGLPKALKIYLNDLSSVTDVRHSDVGDLVSLCHQLYSASDLMSIHWDERLTRAAAFFGDAVCFPKLNRYYTSIIENQLVGSDIRSAVLLSVTRNFRQHIPIKLIGWLLSLPDIDVNLKCPLLVLREETAHNLGPLDFIKESPFTRLLGYGLEDIIWRLMGSKCGYKTRQNRDSATQFLRLVSDFAFHGANFHSTMLMAFHPDYQFSATQFGSLCLLQIPGKNLSSWSGFERNNDKFLCVLALQATSVIQQMLASFLKTEPGHENPDEDGHSPREDECSAAELDQAVSFLSQRCQESGGGAKDRVIGFLHRSDSFADMPYRKVGEQDSANLLEMIWACVFEGVSQDPGSRCREVIARSPFSSIGLRDYVRDMGLFDGLAAHKLQLEYKRGIVTPPTACLFEIWQ